MSSRVLKILTLLVTINILTRLRAAFALSSSLWGQLCDDTACTINCGKSHQVSDTVCFGFEYGRKSIMLHHTDPGGSSADGSGFALVASSDDDCGCQSSCVGTADSHRDSSTHCLDVSGFKNVSAARAFRFISGVCPSDNCAQPTSPQPPPPPPPSPQPQSPQHSISQLDQCSPCGSISCSFQAESQSSTHFTLLVGAPLENCNGTQGNLTLTIGGRQTLSDTWSMSESIGISIGLVVGGSSTTTFGWSQTQGIEYSQQISVDVPPGSKTALTATVQYTSTKGSMAIAEGNIPLLPVLSNQPVMVIGYGSQTIPCSGNFQVDSPSAAQCSSESAAQRRAVNWWRMVVILGIFLFQVTLL